MRNTEKRKTERKDWTVRLLRKPVHQTRRCDKLQALLNQFNVAALIPHMHFPLCSCWIPVGFRSRQFNKGRVKDNPISLAKWEQLTSRRGLTIYSCVSRFDNES
jgi:hypothetical protein